MQRPPCHCQAELGWKPVCMVQTFATSTSQLPAVLPGPQGPTAHTPRAGAASPRRSIPYSGRDQENIPVLLLFICFSLLGGKVL